MQYIIQLGAPNSPTGELSPVAVSRTKKTAELARENPNSSLILTGGWGQHFNEAPFPHGRYVERSLVDDYKIEAIRIVDVLESDNTVEDAVLVRPYIKSGDRLTVVTSDFHKARAEFVFKCVLGQNVFLEVHAVESSFLNPEEKKSINDHEQQSLLSLKAQGGVIWEGNLYQSR